MHIITDYEKEMNLNNNVIIAGDLNSKHTNWGAHNMPCLKYEWYVCKFPNTE